MRLYRHHVYKEYLQFTKKYKDDNYPQRRTYISSILDRFMKDKCAVLISWRKNKTIQKNEFKSIKENLLLNYKTQKLEFYKEKS